MGRLEKSLAHLAWWHSAGCVLDVFRDNQRREQEGKSSHEASADAWCIFDGLRRDVWERARKFWCERSGEDATCFPLSVDAVAKLYFRFRKRSPQEVCDFQAEIEAKAGAPPLF